MKMTKWLVFLFLLSFTGIVWAQSADYQAIQKEIRSQPTNQRAQQYVTYALANVDKNIDLAGQLVNQSIELSKELNDQPVLADAYNAQGLIFQEKYDYTNAMQSFVAAMRIHSTLNDETGIANSKNNIGLIFFQQEDYMQAEENFTEALELKKKQGDIFGAAKVLKNLGDLYVAKEVYGKALKNYQSALDIFLAEEKFEEAAEIANLTGDVNSNLGDYEGALSYYQMCLSLHSSLNDMPAIADDHHRLTETFLAMNAYEEAAETNRIALEIEEEVNDSFGLVNALVNQSIIANDNGDNVTAQLALERSKTILRAVTTDPQTPVLWKKMTKSYTNFDDYQNALEAQLAYSDSRNELFNQEKSKALLDLTTKYQSEFAAEEQASTIELLELENNNAKKIRYFLFVVIGLIGLFLLSLFLSFKRKQKDNQLLFQKNEKINRQKDEINLQNLQLAESNARLDDLNGKLVNEIAERESIEKSSFARDRFLATMSHEMRTPINIIIGLTHLLLDENPREDQINHLRTLQFSANNLVVFINDVLDFSKIEAGKLELDNRAFSPKRVFKDIRDRFEVAAAEKDLTINYSYDNKIPDELMGDSARLNQILNNLIAVSTNYTPKGQINVNLKLSELGKKEAILMLHIRDNGEKIEREKIESMFKSFANNPNDIFEGYASSNLSLAITKRLVDLQKGKIEVEHNDNGNSFVVLLPFKVSETKKTQKLPAKDFSHLAGSTILFVEDNKINQLVVAKMLRKLNIEVITADDGLIALEKFEQYPFDLVLMDIQMPNMDGYRATAEIRKHIDPNKRDVPIIALTASAFLTEKEKARLFGMNDHVGKPFGPEELLEKIGHALRVHRSM